MWRAEDDLRSLGLTATGANVCIDEAALLLGAGNLSVGDRSRIDAFALVSAGKGGIRLGRHVHIASGARLYSGDEGVEIEDYAGISAGVSIFSVSDEYSGGHLTNPTVPAEYRSVRHGRVVVGRHVLVGAGSVVLPGVEIGEGAAIGALTLVHRSVPSGTVVAGNPMRRIGTRDVDRLRAEQARLEREERDALAG